MNPVNVIPHLLYKIRPGQASGPLKQIHATYPAHLAATNVMGWNPS